MLEENAVTGRTLTGKVALVTGAGRRIGAAIVRMLHTAGANMVVHYHHSEAEAFALQAELNQLRACSCFLVQGDLLDVDRHQGLIAEVLQKAGRLDVLVNNASRFYTTTMGTISSAEWDELVGINMKVPLFLSQAAMSELGVNKGCIINMVDVHGVRPLPNHTVYCAAKAGLLMLTQSLAREFGPDVRVNGVAPGAILWPEQGMVESEQDELLNKTVLRRLGKVDDIARTVLFLIRDADYITGQVIPVDGGRMLNH